MKYIQTIGIIYYENDEDMGRGQMVHGNVDMWIVMVNCLRILYNAQ